MMTLTLDELEVNAIAAALDERLARLYREITTLKEQRDSPDNRFAIECNNDAIRYTLRVQLAMAETADAPEYPDTMTVAMFDSMPQLAEAERRGMWGDR